MTDDPEDARTIVDDGVTYEVVWSGSLSRQNVCTGLSSPYLQRRERVVGWAVSQDDDRNKRGRPPRLPVLALVSP